MKIINILSPIFLGVALAFLLSTCSKFNKERKRADSFEKKYHECIDAPVTHDTVWNDTTVVVSVPTPYPVVDTIFLDKVVVVSSKLRYRDTIPYEELDLSYDITTIGSLDELSLTYFLKVPKTIEHTKVIKEEVEVPYCKPKVYLWGTVSSDLNSLSGGGQLSYKKVMAGYEYSFNTEYPHRVRVGYRIN